MSPLFYAKLMLCAMTVGMSSYLKNSKNLEQFYPDLKKLHVIPAQAGIQSGAYMAHRPYRAFWIPAWAGMTAGFEPDGPKHDHVCWSR